MLDDYEVSVLFARVEIKKKWFQFWLPKYSVVEMGSYTRIGEVVELNIKFGDLFLSGKETNGSFVGTINGLP